MAPRHARFPNTPLLIGAQRTPDGRIITTYPEPIQDAYRFCRQLMDKAMDDWGMHLEPEEYEDSIQELIIHGYRLEKRFDPTRNDSFAGYARGILERRAVDAGPRRILGRTGNRLASRHHEEYDETALGHTRPLQTQPGETSPDRTPTDDRPGLHRNRNSARARAIALLAQREPSLTTT